MYPIAITISIVGIAIMAARIIKFQSRKYVDKTCEGDLYDIGEDTHVVIWPKKQRA